MKTTSHNIYNITIWRLSYSQGDLQKGRGFGLNRLACNTPTNVWPVPFPHTSLDILQSAEDIDHLVHTKNPLK